MKKKLVAFFMAVCMAVPSIGTVGTNQTYKDKKIGILIEDMDNVTVEGNDSLFMFHGKMTTFASIDSENVTFQNFLAEQRCYSE